MTKHYFKIILLSFSGSLLLILSFYFIYVDKMESMDSEFYRGNILILVYLFATHIVLSILLVIYFSVKIPNLKNYATSMILLPHVLFILFMFSTFKANGVMVGGVQILINIGLCIYSLWKIPLILSSK